MVKVFSQVQKIHDVDILIRDRMPSCYENSKTIKSRIRLFSVSAAMIIESVRRSVLGAFHS